MALKGKPIALVMQGVKKAMGRQVATPMNTARYFVGNLSPTTVYTSPQSLLDEESHGHWCIAVLVTLSFLPKRQACVLLARRSKWDNFPTGQLRNWDLFSACVARRLVPKR